MALSDDIQADLTAAMKARDADRVATLRMVVAAIRNAKVAARSSGEVTDAQTLDLLAKEAKSRTEAAEVYAEAGRTELADKELRELEIIRGYLPTQLDEAELRDIVDAAIADTAATGPADLGRVMSAVMPQVKGRADGKAVNTMVRQRLG
ncbi:GatB/YqeY domain-containing protein [soil metagenome]